MPPHCNLGSSLCQFLDVDSSGSDEMGVQRNEDLCSLKDTTVNWNVDMNSNPIQRVVMKHMNVLCCPMLDLYFI